MTFVQRVRVVIEVGEEGDAMFLTPMIDPVDIGRRKSFRDEREIARALRTLADRIEMGVGFEPVKFKRQRS